MNRNDIIIVVYAFRDGNTRELFYAFDHEAADDASHEAWHDERFGSIGAHVVGFAVVEAE